MVCACKGDLFIEMKYFEFGKENKELMVLLHGGGTSYLGVLPTAEKIAEKYHVVLLAYDGFNPSEPETEFQSLAYEAGCLEDYIIKNYGGKVDINGARGFWPGFWQAFVILSVMNLIDRFLIDEYWVGHTKAWIIPGTEDLRPYITAKDKQRKWIIGTVGMAVIAAVLSGIMALILR